MSQSKKRKAPVGSNDSVEEPSNKKVKPSIRIPTCPALGCLKCKACEKFLKRREELDNLRQKQRLERQKKQEIKDAKNREVQEHLRKQAHGWVAQLTKCLTSDGCYTKLYSFGSFDTEQAAQEAVLSGLVTLAHAEMGGSSMSDDVKDIAKDGTKSLETRFEEIRDILTGENDEFLYGMFVTPLLRPSSSSSAASASSSASPSASNVGPWCESDGHNPCALDSRKIWKGGEPFELDSEEDD